MVKRIRALRFLLLAVLLSAAPLAGCSTNKSAQDDKPLLMADVIGVTHTQGKYHFTSYDYLREGADEIQGLGTHVIKLWFNARPADNYPYNSDWSQFGSLHSLTDLAKTSYYREVFERPQFKTVILEASEYSNGVTSDWKDGLSKAEADSIYKEFYELTSYLYDTYQGTGKTFILQNWESDSALDLFDGAKQQPRPLSAEVQQTRIQGMIDWLNIRQNAIADARKAAGAAGKSGVQVVGAAEVNYMPIDKDYGCPVAIDAVVPHTHMDLYSFSDWKTISPATVSRMDTYLNYIAQKAPDSALYGSKNIYLGELGLFEMSGLTGVISQPTAETDRLGETIIRENVDEALKWGVRYIVHWEMFDNGLRSGVAYVPGKDYAESQLKGTWLRRPDGSYTGIYKFYKSVMNEKVSDYLAKASSAKPE